MGEASGKEGSDGEGKFDLSKDPAFLELQKTMKGMVTILQQQGATISGFRSTMEELKTVSGKGKDDKGSKGENDDPDLESLSPKEFQQFLLGKVGELLEDKLKGVTDRIDGTAREFRLDKLSAEARQLAGDNKDFGDWNDEMGALAKMHPSLTLSQLYRMARDENEGKAKELDVKYKEPELEKDETLTMFGGFRPSGGKTPSGEGDKKMTADEALEKSWNDAVSKFPALGKLGDDAVD